MPAESKHASLVRPLRFKPANVQICTCSSRSAVFLRARSAASLVTIAHAVQQPSSNSSYLSAREKTHKNSCTRQEASTAHFELVREPVKQRREKKSTKCERLCMHLMCVHSPVYRSPDANHACGACSSEQRQRVTAYTRRTKTPNTAVRLLPARLPLSSTLVARRSSYSSAEQLVFSRNSDAWHPLHGQGRPDKQTQHARAGTSSMNT